MVRWTLLLLFSPYSLYAFKVSPIELEFSPAGASSVQTITVENTTPSKIPVEVSAYNRVHIAGVEKRLPTNDFSYFPKQFILKPGESRNVRITWMGERDALAIKGKGAVMQKGNANIKSEKAYRLEVKQVPVNLKSKKSSKSGIKFLYNYIASLYVKPEGIKPKVEVVSFTKKDQNTFVFDIVNKGGEHALLAQYNLFIYPKGSKKPFIVKMKSQKQDILGVNLLAGEKRKVSLNIPENIMKSKGARFVFSEDK